MRAGSGNGSQYEYFLWKWLSKSLAKKEAIYFCIVLLITKCMRAEIKRDEKLLIDLEGPNG